MEDTNERRHTWAEWEAWRDARAGVDFTADDLREAARLLALAPGRRVEALGRMGAEELAEFLMEEEREARRARDARPVFIGEDVY